MALNFSRFYRRNRFVLKCEGVTPMFLGNANQEAELRSAPFKGLLRYWWRVAKGTKYADHHDLLAAENRIFGSADGTTGGKSLVSVEVRQIDNVSPIRKGFKSQDKISHRECKKTNEKVDPLGYLAGMGLIHFHKGIQHSYFPTGTKFECVLTVAEQAVEDIKAVLTLWSRFGAIGSRSRNGWGCFGFDWDEDSVFSRRDFQDAFDRDYPHCLGVNEKGDLVWKTRRTHRSWEDAMKELAEIYVNVRISLDVNNPKRPDRHILGYPVTNHFIYPRKKDGKINEKDPEYAWRKYWGKKGRHASALRLIVRKIAKGYHGYILHLPHLFSKKMWPNEKDRQIRIWNKVHDTLDNICSRARYEEVGK